MRITCDGSGLRWRTGVSRLHVIGGLLVLLMVAVAGCGDAEPDVTVELSIATRGTGSTHFSTCAVSATRRRHMDSRFIGRSPNH